MILKDRNLMIKNIGWEFDYIIFKDGKPVLPRPTGWDQLPLPVLQMVLGVGEIGSENVCGN